MEIRKAETAKKPEQEVTQVLSNPASEPKKRAPRVSLALAKTRLSVPDVPGFHLYWFKEENIPAALDAYYEPVKRGELSLNPLGIGGNLNSDGNTDLGSNVSIVAGTNSIGQPVRLILMKLPLEYYKEDQKMIEQRNMSIMEAIFGDEAKTFDQAGGMKELDSLTYRKTALFNRPKRKVPKVTAGTKELKARLERLEKMMSSRD